MSSDVDLRGLAIDRGGARMLRPRRQAITRYLLPLVLIIGFLSLVGWATRDYLFPARSVRVMPVLATTAEVRQEGTPLFNAAGWIEPRPTPVRVAALAPGVVEKLLVVEDQIVKSGEPVAQLVKDDAVLAHRSAMADLELRQAELDEARAAVVAAKTRFEQPVHLQAALSQAEAHLAKIETELENLPFAVRRAEADSEATQKDHEGKVRAQGVIAAVQIDIAKSKAVAAQALVDELRNRDASLKSERAALVGRRDALSMQLRLLADETKAKDEAAAQVKAATARVAQARVAVDIARLQLDRMTVVSPIDGRVFRLIAHPGARIGGGMTQMTGHDGSTVVTLYRPAMLQVRVDVRFEDIPQVSLKQPVRIGNPALPFPLTGKVLFISSEADIQKNTLQVKVEIPDPPPVFKPEMLVDVTFLAPKQHARNLERATQLRIYVPPQAIHRSDGSSFVWVADQSRGIARKTLVETGAVSVNGLVEVTRGLSVSSRIIVADADGLADGDPIRVTGEERTTEDGRAGGQESSGVVQSNGSRLR